MKDNGPSAARSDPHHHSRHPSTRHIRRLARTQLPARRGTGPDQPQVREWLANRCLKEGRSPLVWMNPKIYPSRRDFATTYAIKLFACETTVEPQSSAIPSPICIAHQYRRSLLDGHHNGGVPRGTRDARDTCRRPGAD